MDIVFFKEARKHLSMDVLEKGSLSYVQAIVLMANYLQKRNKPNAAFILVGIGFSMALAIGLHREFGKPSTSPFTMEIRRRVWWTLFIFVSAVQLILGRPAVSLVGVNVVKPIGNTHDYGSESADKHGSVIRPCLFRISTNSQSDVIPKFLGVLCKSAEEVDCLLLHNRVVLNDGIVVQVLVKDTSIVSPVCTVVHHGKAVAEINAEDHCQVSARSRISGINIQLTNRQCRPIRVHRSVLLHKIFGAVQGAKNQDWLAHSFKVDHIAWKVRQNGQPCRHGTDSRGAIRTILLGPLLVHLPLLSLRELE